MPELIKAPQNVGQLVLGRYGSIRYDLLPQRASVIPLKPVNITDGNNSLVYELNESKVLAIDYGGDLVRPLAAQLLAHYHNIAHILHPEHFPRFYAVYAPSFDKNGRVIPGGSIRERVTPGPDIETVEGLFSQGVDSNVKRIQIGPASMNQYNVPDVLFNKMKEWIENGIPLRLENVRLKNVAVDQEGRIRYFDVLDEVRPLLERFYASGELPWWDLVTIGEFMKRKGYDEYKIDMVLKSASRARELTIRGEAITDWREDKLIGEGLPLEDHFKRVKDFYKDQSAVYSSKDQVYADAYLRIREAY